MLIKLQNLLIINKFVLLDCCPCLIKVIIIKYPVGWTQYIFKDELYIAFI